MSSACCVYDFTSFNYDIDSVKSLLKEHCKKWCFQEELAPSTMKKHLQGRFSLKLKKRINNIPFNIGRYSVTSNANKNNDFYVCKQDTRIAGPWKDTDIEVYIPKQVRDIPSLFKWQQQVIDSFKIWDTRHINLVYCPHGNIGKSTLVSYCRAHRLARAFPPVNDYKDVLRMVFAHAKNSNNAFIFDMPRAMKKDKLGSFYSAIETVKDGYAYDDRYSFREKVFDCPVIWIFSNLLPDYNLLSQDRWRTWIVNKNSQIELHQEDESDSE